MSEASGFIRAQPDFIPSFYLPKGKYTHWKMGLFSVGLGAKIN